MWQPTNNLEEERLSKANELRERGVELYPRRAHRTHTTVEAIAAFEAKEAEDAEAAEQIEVTVAGRIRRLNIKGKVSFAHFEDEHGRLQLFLRINDMDADAYDLVKEKLVEVDDFVQATGTMTRTRAGEVSVRVQTIKLLAKALTPLPVIKKQVLDDGTVKEYGEFTDKEARYRQRYADLAVNTDVRDVFRVRAKALRAMRAFLDSEGMLEVETPILQPIYGGAAARPFTTHHNQLDQQLYLRISFELYLKRLIVGGYDAVYEIGRDFRNEGVSYKHNPEFTMMEFYKAYIDYREVMEIVERMYAHIVEVIHGGPQLTYQGYEIDFTPPWDRMTIREAIETYTGIDYMAYPDADALRAVLKDELNITADPNEPWGRMIVERLLSHIEPQLIQPTIIMDYPREMSPFAKPTEYDDNHTERFEIFMAGIEMGNAFTELNDPLDQEARFREMADLYGRGDDEETPFDEDFLQAMRYGMPPMGGFGMGVDRFVMLLTDQRSIRDVLFFPHLKSIAVRAEATDEAEQ